VAGPSGADAGGWPQLLVSDCGFDSSFFAPDFLLSSWRELRE
jgi:hypothetical protein